MGDFTASVPRGDDRRLCTALANTRRSRAFSREAQCASLAGSPSPNGERGRRTGASRGSRFKEEKKMSRMKLLLLLLATLMCLPPYRANARVVRFVVEQRTILANGMNWGNAGPYERLNGTAHMEVDPKDPLNSVIVNLDKAPRNARGMVEFSSPFRVLKPVDMTRGNRKIWYGMNNRGNCIELGFRSF